MTKYHKSAEVIATLKPEQYRVTQENGTAPPPPLHTHANSHSHLTPAHILLLKNYVYIILIRK